MNKVIIIGNLGRDPEMRFTPSGQAVTKFSIASTRQYKNQSGEQVKETTWFNVEAWGKLAEICNTYLKKGSKVYVEGRMKPDRTTGNPHVYEKKDGSAGSSFDVSASDVQFLDRKGEKEKETEGSTPFDGNEETYPY